MLASGVYAIRFDFGSQKNSWVGYAELEAIGTAIGVVSNILPTSTALTVASGSTLDLGGAIQQVASLSDSTPGSGGRIIEQFNWHCIRPHAQPTGGVDHLQRHDQEAALGPD